MHGPLRTMSVDALSAHIGKELGTSEWFRIDQKTIDAFADLTHDHYFIHTDPARAAATPFGGTIAHGFLTLSLVSALMRNAIAFTGHRMAINYGLNRVRFIAAVPSGSRVRARVTPVAVADAGDSVQVTWSITVEREGADKPCCVAEWIVRYYPQSAVK